MRHLRLRLSANAWFVLIATLSAVEPSNQTSNLPHADAKFSGIAERTLAGSKPDFPPPTVAPAGAPNVLLILVDDAGFGNPSAFGGPVQTPTLDRLASQGLRYNRFHVTALCSPTRAALLSGRNHHAIGFGSIAEMAGGWPGYNATWPKSAASVARILQGNGYTTAAFGKWHLTPDNQQGPAGPFDRWPCGLGFDYFWGFLGGAVGQYDPLLAENNTIVGVPPEHDYYFPTDMANRAIRWIRDQKEQAPDRPFFMYYAPGASHSPHHVPHAWADKYRGRFDQGWDHLREQTFAQQKRLGVIPEGAQLTPRDPAFPAWDAVAANLRPLYTRQMEVFAGFQENCDYEIGRVVQAIDDLGIGDNTLILYIWGDNGSSMEGTETGTFNEMTTITGVPVPADEQLKLIDQYGGIEAWGGPRTQPHFACAWAWAGNTPFQWGKQVASHLGGTRNPMVVSWPRRIKDTGSVRSQFSHVIDVAPTILEAAGIAAPQRVDGIEQMPIHGTSFVYSFDDPKAKERHTQQYFEIFGNRAMYKDGWIACARLARSPWEVDPAALAKFSPDSGWNPDSDRWELYDLDADFSEANNVASSNPEKLAELKQLFWQEAERYHVTPLLGGIASFYGFAGPGSKRTKYVYDSGAQNIGPGMIPQVYNRSFTIDADLDTSAEGVEGVIVANSDELGGFALYMQNGRLHYTYSFLGLKIDTLTSTQPLPTGKVAVRYEFTADRPGQLSTGGRGRLFIDGKAVGENRIERTCPSRFSSYAGLDIGRDNGEVVSHSYADKAPFAFTGTIERVVFEIRME
ncbi:MAG TPA: sulfatase-like hydrolase/transferase [Pirellulales bacterium]|nr:sulfatase-like hydrolase/transferase [Pirellulales bacterium]